ncbi:hypothetical protein B0G69_6378 [Paraburkholderia sp. RAU2J]|nr:hypothetical protein B0G69_6378 [Paraburkholderia sp. RAU2J]
MTKGRCGRHEGYGAGDGADGDAGNPADSVRHAGDTVDAIAVMRGAVDLLAKGWPEEYPAGAVEWLLLES